MKIQKFSKIKVSYSTKKQIIKTVIKKISKIVDNLKILLHLINLQKWEGPNQLIIIIVFKIQNKVKISLLINQPNNNNNNKIKI